MSKRYIDLTHPIHEGMTVFPAYWHPRVEVTQMGRHETEQRETRKVLVGTHTGTHCDAPLHFIPNGKPVDEIPVDTFIGAAVVVDFSKLVPGTEIGVSHFEKAIGGRKPRRVVMRFDWSDHWGKENFYKGHSYLSEDAARWLVKSGVKLLGMDTPMPDNPLNGRGSANDSPIHKILLGSGVILIEYLCNLRALRKTEIELIALPMKVRGGDGAPVRCVAVEA